MKRHNHDIRSSLQITLEEAAHGCVKTLEVERWKRCAACQGADNTASANCASCLGSRQIAQPLSVEVKVPAGVDEGSLLRIAGAGHLRNAPAGDLFVSVAVQADSRWLRKGVHLYGKERIVAVRKPTGVVAVVPTLEGEAEIPLPKTHRSGDILRLRGRGMPASFPQAGRGDLHFKVWLASPLGKQKPPKRSAKPSKKSDQRD